MLQVDGENVGIELSNYVSNGSLAVILTCNEGHSTYAVITVNLDDGMAGDGLAYVDTNNCPWAEKFITSNKLGVKTEFVGQSGFCTYPMYAFDVKKLQKLSAQ